MLSYRKCPLLYIIHYRICCAFADDVKPTNASPSQHFHRFYFVEPSHHSGHGPRLSKVNLFTLLSLWMELFPQERQEEDESSQVSKTLTVKHFLVLILWLATVWLLSYLQVRGLGLVVVRDGKMLGLHCSGAELHAGQAAVLQHGASLAHCQLYFSRRPCATCLKMIVNGEERDPEDYNSVHLLEQEF